MSRRKLLERLHTNGNLTIIGLENNLEINNYLKFVPCLFTSCLFPASQIQAAHIIHRYISEDSYKDDISNGILLYSPVHYEWDFGRIIIDPINWQLYSFTSIHGTNIVYNRLTKLFVTINNSDDGNVEVNNHGQTNIINDSVIRQPFLVPQTTCKDTPGTVNFINKQPTASLVNEVVSCFTYYNNYTFHISETKQKYLIMRLILFCESMARIPEIIEPIQPTNIFHQLLRDCYRQPLIDQNYDIDLSKYTNHNIVKTAFNELCDKNWTITHITLHGERKYTWSRINDNQIRRTCQRSSRSRMTQGVMYSHQFGGNIDEDDDMLTSCNNCFAIIKLSCINAHIEAFHNESTEYHRVEIKNDAMQSKYVTTIDMTPQTASKRTRPFTPVTPLAPPVFDDLSFLDAVPPSIVRNPQSGGSVQNLLNNSEQVLKLSNKFTDIIGVTIQYL